jgi:hypothetical protein
MNLAYSQGFKDRIVNKLWILETARIDSAKNFTFSAFEKEKVGINTMIWKFLPNGKLSYDYQSNDDVEGCLGVDFLDLDLNACSWKWDPVNYKLTLQLKGGYAGIDDFILKNEYNVFFDFKESSLQGFSLQEFKPFFFKILNPEYARP